MHCYCGCGQETKRIRWSDSSRGLVRGQHFKYVRGHANRRPVDDYDVAPNGCWVWRGAEGYASATWAMRQDGFKVAHRWYYWKANGYCPDTLDHLCRNPSCVNPAHLEECSRGENVRRGDVAILTWEVVAELREAASRLSGSQRHKADVLAPAFGVAPGTVRGILRGVRWPEDARPEVA